MAKIGDLKRFEDQLYQYHPELRCDSENLKLERRNRLFIQLHSSQPEVQLVALDPVSSLTNIKSILEKCKDVVLDYSQIISSTPDTMSPAMSFIESSGDECLGTQRPRRTATRKRRMTSIQFNGSEVNTSEYGQKDDSPLSLSILIPQVVKGSEKMEISIDLGELDASQRLFAGRVDELLRKRSNSGHQLEDVPLKENLNSSKDFQLPISTSSTIETINENNEKQEDEMLSRLISQVLVENHEAETLQATNLLDNINNNERSNYSVDVPNAVDSSEKQLVKKKRQRKSKKSAYVDKEPHKKRGRKPKNKSEKQNSIEYAEMAKSDLAKYVELFSNTCNMAGSATPAASSTVSQQLVTSTTHYLDSNDQQPITYYLEGDWENGGNCQLVQTDNTHIDGGQEEFNMAELVNYIDNVGDVGNAIARVLDGPTSLPVLIQDSQSQSNTIVPPPAHVSDVLLDLSKRSTISYSLSTPNIFNVRTETTNQDLMPLDLSLKSSKLIQTSIYHTSLAPLETNNCAGKLNETTEAVFGGHDYASFGAALEMPLIDLEDNINAFMQLTNNEVITSAPRPVNTSTDCALSIKETANNTLPICDFELGEILSESPLCNNNCNHNSQSNSKIGDLNVNVVKNGEKGNALDQRRNVNEIRTNTESLKTTAGTNERTDTVDVGGYENLTQNNSETAFSQDSNRGDAKKDNISNIEPKSANVVVNSEDKAGRSPTERCIDHIDELRGDSDDFLFVDTESLMSNKLKSSYDGNDIESDYDAACDLSAKDDHTKSIDLVEDHQSHMVSVHLPIPQLTLMETNSEGFTYDYETDTESSEEKDTAVAEKSQVVAIQQYNEENDANESQKSDNLGCNDSGIGNSVADNVCNCAETVRRSTLTVFGNKNNNNNNNHSRVSNFITEETEEITTTYSSSNGSDECNEEEVCEAVHSLTWENSGLSLEDSVSCCSCKQEAANTIQAEETETQDLKQTNHREENESSNKSVDVSSGGLQKVFTEKVEAELTPQNSIESDQRQVIDGVSNNVKVNVADANRNLSVLEMELKMNDDCLDFEDETEDDALSLATSCFNSSDDERCPDMDRAHEATKNLNSDITNKNNENPQAENIIENEEMVDDTNTVVKMEAAQCSTNVSNHVLKKFKIPKISMTTATTKHGSTTENVATAAALPMVILPTNAFNKQIIKTEPDVIKQLNLEKITRTVQNVCAVTPLTQQQPTYQSQSNAITQNSFETLKPLMREVLQLPTSSKEEDEDMKSLKAVDDNKQIVCKNGKFASIKGDSRNSSRHSSRHTIVIAKTFGVTCLPFLVDRCFKLGNCEFSHKFREPEAVGKILLTFSEMDLNITYRFAYNHESLFRRYMHEFCRVYSLRNNRIKLLNMARDCERYPEGSKLLATIFHSLEYCGLNKMNACRQILSYSQDRSQETIDLLLDIILESDWTMFCDHIEKFIGITSYKFRVNVLHQMAPTILEANDQRMTSLFFKCLVNLDSNDVGLVQSSPILMQLLELIKNGQICR